MSGTVYQWVKPCALETGGRNVLLTFLQEEPDPGRSPRCHTRFDTRTPVWGAGCSSCTPAVVEREYFIPWFWVLPWQTGLWWVLGWPEVLLWQHHLQLQQIWSSGEFSCSILPEWVVFFRGRWLHQLWEFVLVTAQGNHLSKHQGYAAAQGIAKAATWNILVWEGSSPASFWTSCFGW